MADDITTLTIQVKSAGVDEAAKGLKGLGSAADEAEKKTKKFGDTSSGLKSPISSATSAVQGLYAAFIAYGGLRIFDTVVDTATAYQTLQASLKLATGSAEAASVAYQDLREITKASHADLRETANLYSKLTMSLSQLDLGHQAILTTTDSVGKSLRLSGAGAQESEAAIRQLGQAMASGMLRGDEFNSVMENSPRLARAIADGMGVAVTALRDMAHEGELTSARVTAALISQNDVLTKEMESIPETVQTVMQDIRNEMFDTLGNTATGPLVDSLKDLRDVLADPEIKSGITDLASGITDLAAAIVKAGAAAGSAYGAMKSYFDLLDENEKRTDKTGLKAASMELEQFKANLEQLEKAKAQGGAWGLFAGGQTGIGLDIHLDEDEIQRQIDVTKEYIKTLDEIVNGNEKVQASEKEKAEAEKSAALERLKQAEIDQQNDKLRKAQLEDMDKFIEKMQKQADTQGMTNTQLAEYTANLNKATPAQRELAIAAAQKADAQEAATEADRKAKQATAELIAEEERRVKSIKSIIDNLKEQAATRDMSEAERVEYQLRNLQAGENQIREAKRLANENALLDLEDQLLTEEERIRQSYERRMELINAMPDGERKDDLAARAGQDFSTGIIGDWAETTPMGLEEELAQEQIAFEAKMKQAEGNNKLMEELTRLHKDRIFAIHQKSNMQMLAQGQMFFDGMAGIAEVFFGKQSKEYKAMFAIAKAFQIAQAMMAAYSGATKAYDSMSGIPYVGPVLGAAAAASALAMGLANVGTIKSQNINAYDKGGRIPAGQVGIVGEKGAELISGPANVTSRKETANMLKKSSESTQPKILVVNLLDKSELVDSFRNSDEFDEVIVNSLSRNRQASREALA